MFLRDTVISDSTRDLVLLLRSQYKRDTALAGLVGLGLEWRCIEKEQLRLRAF